MFEGDKVSCNVRGKASKTLFKDCNPQAVYYSKCTWQSMGLKAATSLRDDRCWWMLLDSIIITCYTFF
jgi:hypothetical protein